MKLPAASLLALTFPALLSATEYDFRVVDFPGAADTVIFAVNNEGQFVGAETDAASLQHAILDDGKHLRLLDPTGIVGSSHQSLAFSINNRGEIAGSYQTDAGAFHGFVRHPDGMITEIDFPGGFDTQAFGINDRGRVIGVYNDASGKQHAFLLHHGQFRTTDIPGGTTTPLSINDRDQVVGDFTTTPHTNGFGYFMDSEGRFKLTTAPGSVPQGTFFISINNREQILGDFQDASGAQQNFLKTGDDYALFNVPVRFAATLVSAQTINDHDKIVGFYNDASNVSHGFIATPR